DPTPAKPAAQGAVYPSKVESGIQALPKQDASKPAINLPADCGLAVESSPFTGRVSLRTDVGDGVGYTRGFTYLEGMFPVQQDDKSLLFADLRVVNFDHENRWEYNLGGGYRWYSCNFDHVLGVNAFYDARKTDFHYYQQIGIGF